MLYYDCLPAGFFEAEFFLDLELLFDIGTFSYTVLYINVTMLGGI
jgi:hypothetical protein